MTPEKIIAELRRPFTPEAVKWKVQANPKSQDKSALIVGFIDARLAAERLNAVVPGQWSSAFAPLPADGGFSGVRCKVTIRFEDGTEISREDVGTFPSGSAAEIVVKGGYSDAFKRACVQFGIGVSIYATPQQWLGKGEGLKYYPKGDKITAFMTPAAEKVLKQRYAAWLESHGKTYFGEPLSHGEVEGEQGDIEVDTPVGEAEPEEGKEAAPEDKKLTPKAAKEIKDTVIEVGIAPEAVRNKLTASYRKTKITELTVSEGAEFAKWVVDQAAGQ